MAVQISAIKRAQLWLAQSQSFSRLPLVVTLGDVFSVFTDFANLTTCHFGPFLAIFVETQKRYKRSKTPVNAKNRLISVQKRG